jgi:plastocyanin domain-containing protein
MYNIKIPGLYEKPIRLLAGRQIVMDFTPTEIGEYPITCGMGMQRGLLIVE